MFGEALPQPLYHFQRGRGRRAGALQYPRNHGRRRGGEPALVAQIPAGRVSKTERGTGFEPAASCLEGWKRDALCYSLETIRKTVQLECEFFAL